MAVQTVNALRTLAQQVGRGAYELARQLGFTGSEQDWLDSVSASTGIVMIYTKSIQNKLSGSPQDIAQIAVPASITRFRVYGTTAAQTGHFIVTESQTGTPAAGTIAVFDQAGGAGNQVMATQAPNNGAGGGVNWASQSSSVIYTAQTLFVRQMADALNSAVLSFYMLVEPIP